MRPATKSALAATAASALSVALLPGIAEAGQPAASPGAHDRASGAGHYPSDNLPNPIADKQNALRDKAINMLLRGKADLQRRPGSDVVRLGRGQYAEVSRRATDTNPDQILTFLVDFGKKHMDGTAPGVPGPVHGHLKRPDRSRDNSTYWEPNFNRSHYLDLFFGGKNSMANFYKKQSSGQYALSGDVSKWVKVPYRESRYGYNRNGNVITAGGAWNFIKDSARAWYRSKINAGWSNAQVKNYLSKFDQWDRYDQDGDGNFNEPDGYIDHFQAVHAGKGEEAGAPPWTIWSHRWYTFPTLYGQAGPAGYAKQGGVRIGKSGFWIGDYTTEPENGGLGVFCHEYGHDLGLADYYDTAGGDNGTGFWTIMSVGSWLNRGGNSIGTKPGFMGAHEKLLLGWAEYKYLPYTAGSTRKARLGTAERRSTRGPQELVVGLPKASHAIRNKPHSPTHEWWGGTADNLNSTLTHSGWDLSNATSAKLTAWAWYRIEKGYDYLYGEVSADGGTTWKVVKPVGSTNSNGGIDGNSNGWRKISYDLSKYAGQNNVAFRFRYQTDGGVHYAGPFLDDFKLILDGQPAYTDDVEGGADGWTAAGSWKISTGTEAKTATQYYLVENRRYISYDKSLRTGPYNFGWPYSRPNWVERFPYQDGMLVWYWNNMYFDNNTSVHPGHGWALPVDSRPAPITFADGSLLGNRRQPFDATFGTSVTDRVTFHREIMTKSGDLRVMKATVPARHQRTVFDDSVKNRYWSNANPWNSTKVAGSGTRIRVLYESANGYRMLVRVKQAM